MKIYEILKEENKGKIYKCNNLEVKVIDKGSEGLFLLSLHENDGEVPLSSYFLNLEFEEVKPKLKGWEKDKENYYVISDYNIEEYDNNNNKFDNELFNKANYFSTKEKAKEVYNEQMLYRLIKRFRDMNNTEEIDWNDQSTYKYVIFQNMHNKSYGVVADSRVKQINGIYFSKKELAQRCIDEIIIPFYKNLNKESQVEEDDDTNKIKVFKNTVKSIKTKMKK